MTTQKFNQQGFQFSIVGNIPTGMDSTTMLEHVKSLNTPKGSFKMQVTEKGTGTISTINFKKL